MSSLGPQWSPKELRTFYILLKAHGQTWDKLEERLPHRSEVMVRALFSMHRGYLSLPEASVEGFCAIMADHYKMQDDIQKQKAGWDFNTPDQDAEQDEAPFRSRKKRRLEKFLVTGQVATPQPDEPISEQKKLKKSTKGRKNPTPGRFRAWLPREDSSHSGLSKVRGERFNFPWYHWFYSFVDVDFFRHNEFIECLSGMGLGEITAAARPIWSSVRASMGRPRRLSSRFFIQEKEKLEAYRTVKRKLNSKQKPKNRTWPYRCPAPLDPGVVVMVWVQTERRFQLATVVAFSPREESCRVFICGDISSVEAVTCSLDNVMVLDFPPWSAKTKVVSTETKLTATTLLRRERKPRGSKAVVSAPERPSSSATDRSRECTTRASVAPVSAPEKRPFSSATDRFREEKIRAVLTVKSLLQRKEKIITTMTKLNERVAERKMCVQELLSMNFSLWATPTTFSSAAVREYVWGDSREKIHLQRQRAWLAANLDATNSYLKAALLNLQSISSTDHVEARGSSMMGLVYSSDAVPWEGDSTQVPTETLKEDEMRWAIDYLAASQQKADTVVAESALQIAKEDHALSVLNASRNNDQLNKVLPETMQLVANCVTLMSVLHRHVAASPDVPRVVTQKLVERVLELLKPSNETNMDLYTELCAAAEAAQSQMATNNNQWI